MPISQYFLAASQIWSLFFAKRISMRDRDWQLSLLRRDFNI